MANTLRNEYTLQGVKHYVFNMTSAAGATETLQLPPGKEVLGVLTPAFTSATGRAITAAYVVATGVLSIGGLTAADAALITVQTN